MLGIDLVVLFYLCEEIVIQVMLGLMIIYVVQYFFFQL